MWRALQRAVSRLVSTPGRGPSTFKQRILAGQDLPHVFLIVLAGAAVHVSLRAVAHEGSAPMAEVQAQLDEQQGASPVPSLRKAVALSPQEAIYHSRLGLALETQGELEEAERELVQGTQLSRKYEPRWDLLNFYFRRSNWEGFWRGAPEALAISWGDRAPLFELASQAESGPARLRQMLPSRREVRFNYAVFLIGQGDLKAAAPLISELATTVSLDERTTFLYWVDLLLQKGMVSEALQTWRALGEAEEPFPWKPAKIPGVTIHALEPGWQILLNGDQPEHCVLLEAFRPVNAGGTYRLQADVDQKLSPAGGVLWHVETLEAQPRILADSFKVPAGIEAVRIRLEYQRPSGSVRGEGEVRVRSVVVQKGQ